jgi:hypothetical protein
VLEDRLLIEGVHAILRATRTRAPQSVITSDVLLARVLETEGIPCLFIPSVSLPPCKIPCLRFSPFANSFVGASLPDLLWDLTHALGSVRVSTADGEVCLRLEAYWPQKTPTDWREEHLRLEFSSIMENGASLGSPRVSEEGDSRDYPDCGQLAVERFSTASVPFSDHPVCSWHATATPG